MNSFIHDDFLLQSETARRLYHEVAKDEPIYDYHCHLPPQEVAEDKRFADLAEIWLGGDHYKWRAMRTDGVSEKVITGKAEPYEKFTAWCKTVPQTLRNPLYHWSHLELKRYFDIDCLIDEKTAPKIWEAANAKLAEPEFSAKGILKKFNVRVVCTTDDPADSLQHHQKINADEALQTRVYPTFRPDNAMKLSEAEAFSAYCAKLGKAANVDIGDKLEAFLDALKQRHDFFHEVGGRLSDHGLEQCHDDFCNDSTAAAIFEKAHQGSAISPLEQRQFASYMMVFFGRLDAAKGWTKQLHLGALRSANTRKLREIGPDSGFDSIGDFLQARSLASYLDQLDQSDELPKIVLYNLNPADNYLLATMIGNFQDGSTAGKIQFGSGWWFLDQKEAMEWQMNALSNNGLLSRFVGMLTDSRSFLSYPRHEYFRRVLCNLVGGDVEQGLIPNEWELIAPFVKNICFGNARGFFGLELG